MHYESDPVAAVERFREQPFDVVVSDLRMPGLTGLEMILQIQEFGPPHTEYILLTGNGDLDSAMTAINSAGVFRFLTKPTSTEDLVEAIDAALAAVNLTRDNPGDLASAALAHLSAAVVVVGRDLKVAYLNDSADELAKSSSLVVLDPRGHLRVKTAKGQDALSKAVDSAIQSADIAPRFVKLLDDHEADELKVVVMPLGAGRAAILLSAPDRFEPPSVDSLVELFGLTRVEAALVQTIACGGTIEAAAKSSKVTVETARTYLKRIFQKTGVNRQVDLVQLILSTPASLIRARRKTG